MFVARPVPRLTTDERVALLRRQRPLAVLMALRQMTTIAGVILLRHEELAGRCRAQILRACERRIEELGGTEADRSLHLVVSAVAVDPDLKKWEKRHGKT